jgi:hypothetical protein
MASTTQLEDATPEQATALLAQLLRLERRSLAESQLLLRRNVIN